MLSPNKLTFKLCQSLCQSYYSSLSKEKLLPVWKFILRSNEVERILNKAGNEMPR